MCNKLHNRWGWSVQCLLLLVSILLQQQSWGSAGDKHGTRIEEIVRWVDLSDQYVLGYGYESTPGSLESGGKLIPYAIYDKTFCTPFYSHFWKILLLGTLGISDLNLAQLSKNLPKSKETQIDTPETTIYVSGDFWKDPKIQWKKGKKPALDQASPRVLYSKDFNWSEMIRTKAEVKQAVTALRDSTSLLRDHEDIPLNYEEQVSVTGQLKNTVFLLQSNGTYQLSSDGPEIAIRPVKVIDLRKKHSSFKKAAAWAAMTNIIKGGLNATPIYGAPQAAGAMLERVFDFIEVLYLDRHGQALTLVLEAIAGNTSSPFHTILLSQSDLQDALYYLLRSQSLLSQVMKNLLANNETLTQDYLDQLNDQRAFSIEKLKRRGIEVIPLEDSYFGIGYQRNEQSKELTKLKLYSLGYPKLLRPTKPHAAVDFLHPQRETQLRRVLSGVLMASNFIFTPIPTISTMIKLLYKELVIREMHRRGIWENGYLAHLHHHPHELRDLLRDQVGLSEIQASAYETLAISSIESRRLNPLDLTEEELAQHRVRVERWIRHRDSEYKSH